MLISFYNLQIDIGFFNKYNLMFIIKTNRLLSVILNSDKICRYYAIVIYLPFIVLILVVVFIHEYGHYYFAKKYGVGVTDFSIGFGKEIFGWNDKSGTRWKICWIPLGGYVKFFGDRNVFSQADQEEILKNIIKKSNKSYLF